MLPREKLMIESIAKDLMPNYLGELDKEEYDRRTAITKMLTKIIKEL
jgi:hypothetical protein